MEANEQQILWLLENATQYRIAKETGIPRSTIMYRYAKGLPPEKILERREDNEQN